MLDTTNNSMWAFTPDHPLCPRCAAPDTGELCHCITISAEAAARKREQNLADYAQQRREKGLD